MEESHFLSDDLPLPPTRLLERLGDLPGYTWDQSAEPFHSTYNHWHISGFRHQIESDLSTPIATSSGPASSGPSSFTRFSPRTETRPSARLNRRFSVSETSSELSLSRGGDQDTVWIPVIARVSTNFIRLEREFHMLRSIVQTSDPECNHTVRPIDLIRLPADPVDGGSLLVAIFESPGHDRLRDLVTFGPASFVAGSKGDQNVTPNEQVDLPAFFDFAIGACDCLEILHYGMKTVHGEIRGDAFHLSRETGAVKLANMGNGARSFDNVLSDGWSSVSRELGAKYKLQFIAPEQTGRMPTEPDSRTDIYALGLFFWSMLVGKLPFEGSDPVEVVQNVLTRKLTPVSAKRMDVPDALSAVVQKMTQKVVHDRYHTISSVKRDLAEVAKLLGDGDSEALNNFKIAQRDVSSFFTLPCRMFGRQKEYDTIISTVEKVNKRQANASTKVSTQSPATAHAIASTSSISEGRVDSFEIASISSDSASSFQLPPRTGSNVTQYHIAHVNTHDSVGSNDTTPPPARLSQTSAGPDLPNNTPVLNHTKVKSPSHSRSSHTTDRDSHPSVGTNTPSQPSTHNFSQSESLNSLAKHKTGARYRRNGRCEVIAISGAPGIGKTDLLNRVQPVIRKMGYIAITRLDRAKRVPFEPFAKILASLLRQIFSEQDVNTNYHNSIRSALRSMWPTLHKVLDLPEQLMAPGAKYKPAQRAPISASTAKQEAAEYDQAKRLHIPWIDQGQTSVDFFLSNAASNNMRLMDIFIEILRTLCQFKLITVCLDDIEYADDETTELVLNIIRAKLPCVVTLTARDPNALSDQVRPLFEVETPNITRIILEPLAEDEVMEFVAATMHQEPNSDLTPLAAVVQEKSQGNPFYVRVMLETCYSKNCIWYSWKDSKWQFDLDRIFTEFVAPVYGEGLGLGFLTKRLQEIPPAARAIMVWGALLGSPFSFSLVQHILSSEFLFATDDDQDLDLTSPANVNLVRQTEGDMVVGLQYLIQANLLNTGKTDDEFKFANDRLAQAALSLSKSRNVEKMHFVVSQVLMKYYHDHRSRYSMAHHVALASPTIKARVNRRIDYRRILWEAGQMAAQSGARPTALWYFRHCIALLQDNPWDDTHADVYYDETMRLFIATAEMSWSQAQNQDALKLIDSVFAHGKDAVSKSRAWVIKAKIFAQLGDHHRSMEALLSCLDELGVHLRSPTTYEECDAAFRKLKQYLESATLESITRKPISKDPNIVTIGAVMAEAMAVTYWDDSLTFYRMAIEMMHIHISRGGFTQISIGCSHLAMITLSRFKDIDFGIKLSDLSLSLLENCPELWTQSRGSIVHNLYVSHLRVPLATTLPALEASLEASFTMGDPYITLISVSSMAMTRLYLGQDMGQLEAFCIDAPEDIPQWSQDTRGGASIIAVRQVARALQGKTDFRFPDRVMTDEEHQTTTFMKYLDTHASNADRPRDLYCGLSLIPLFLYGHYHKAIQVGSELLDTSHKLWSVRVTYIIYFYLSASLLTLHNEYPAQGYLDGKMDMLMKYKEEIEFARNCSDANYGMWAFILDALVAEVRNDHSATIQNFEAAIDHCQIHGWPLEEALALELQGEFLIRRGAKRAARALTQEAIAAWNSIGASGKAAMLAEKHEWLLKTATSVRAVDVGCQTVDSLLDITRDAVQEEVVIPLQIEEDERRQRWIEQNGIASEDTPMDISSVGLDIIDLSSILESSQVMSSELQIEKLFTKMLEILLESCNGSDFAVIATNFDDQGFAIAAAADADKGQKSYPEGLPFAETESRMAQHITYYVMRTQEEVLVHNVLEDERFSNVSEAYLANYPQGRSVIALPIVQADNLLGVIHLEGKPNWFTQRNVVVLHLLCNQIGISLSNALLFREIRKVSAKNASMIESQKRALAQARDAEQKAKVAEAEAKHNVKLKEDAARAKSIFLANISHDLRTPMNGVIGLSELLKGTKLDKEQDDYVESIRVCADTLLTLINDILDFSKLEAGKMKISIVPLNLKETISEVIRALRYTHRERGLETIEDLERVPSELVVLGDPVRLHQIFMNLLSNSYKFTPKGSITVKARVGRESKGRVRLECSVSDTGIGIPEEQKARLFRPFSQADPSTERSYGGSGLGLSICKAIIEDVLGGAIWLESEAGVGTTVTFHLVFNKAPKKAAVKTAWSQDLSQAESKQAPRPIIRDLTNIPRNQIRVCIAEDNPINQKIAVKFVTGLGLQCEAYSDGRQAVDALRARSNEGNPFHIVLMDVMMPTLDGYNATRELRRDPDPNVNEVLVIAMTASAIEGDREKCLDAGMNNYLPKPVRSPILSELLDKYLAPVPSHPRTRLVLREKGSRGSIGRDAGTPTSLSSSGSEDTTKQLPPRTPGGK